MDKKNFLSTASLVLLFILNACSTPPEKKTLTISEQLQVDTRKAEILDAQIAKNTKLVKNESIETYLLGVARKLAAVQDGLDVKSIKIKIHDDRDFKMRRFFSFPGTTISIPVSFLKAVAYENELAAALAFELGNVVNRHLADHLDKLKNDETPVLFGPGSIFDLSRQERVESINVGERILYQSGYDLRGMASYFRRYEPKLNGPTNQGSAPIQKEVDFNSKEAQRAKSEYLPSSNPTVRSGEFIQMKKEVGHL